MTYEKNSKEEAVRLSDEIGVKNAAEQLGISYNTLSYWRYKQKCYGSQAYVGSGHKRMSADPKEQEIYQFRKDSAIWVPADRGYTADLYIYVLCGDSAANGSDRSAS